MRLAGLVPHPPSTIGKVLRRHGYSRLPRPERVAARCARRYERERPGELLHVDIKRLGRFWEPGKRVLGVQAGRPQRNRRVGWQHLHVAVDDHSRLAYAELLPGQDADSCVRFLERAAAWYRDQGVIVERVLTDNAKAYHAHAWIDATRQLAIERRYTRIYRPRTNGKAERLIQTLLIEWAYARSYPSSSTEPERSPATCAGTTDADRTARSAPDHRSAASHTSVVTTASYAAEVEARMGRRGRPKPYGAERRRVVREVVDGARACGCESRLGA